MTYHTKLTLNLQAVTYNVQRIRSLAPHSRLLAVIKNNAYGLGVNHVFPSLQHADGFAVIALEEALQVRTLSPQATIVLLRGVHQASELFICQQQRLIPVIHQPEQLQWLLAMRAPIKIWLKFNVGMNRYGFNVSELPSILAQLKTCPWIDPDIVLMTQLPMAHYPEESHTQLQIKQALDLARAEACDLSIANGATIVRYPEACAQWIRPGGLLYGVTTIVNQTGQALGFSPAVSLTSTIISIRTCHQGDRIGYGGLYVCPKDMLIGVVACGYGMGYPVQAPTGTPVMVNGVITQLLGQVAMDVLTVDLSPVPNPKVGDVVELWGANLPVEVVARQIKGSPQSLLTYAGHANRMHTEDGAEVYSHHCA